VAARRRLDLAEAALQADPAGAVSAAYYAMLYAARALLSEQDVYVKTHAGTWHLLRRRFVLTGQIDASLVSRVQGVQRQRERADYEAWMADEGEGREVVRLAREFLGVAESLL